MASVNKVILIGNLGRDPEVRYATSGAAVCTISLATTRSWKDKSSGDKQEETEWHRVVMYDRMAELSGEYLAKGKSVYIEGRLKTRKWTDKDGVEKYTTEIVGEQMQFLSSKGDGGEDTSRARDDYKNDGGGRSPQRQQAEPRRQAAAKPAAKSSTGFDDMDDDIPF